MPLMSLHVAGQGLLARRSDATIAARASVPAAQDGSTAPPLHRVLHIFLLSHAGQGACHPQLRAAVRLGASRPAGALSPPDGPVLPLASGHLMTATPPALPRELNPGLPATRREDPADESGVTRVHATSRPGVERS
jgi:hypothetical protein